MIMAKLASLQAGNHDALRGVLAEVNRDIQP